MVKAGQMALVMLLLMLLSVTIAAVTGVEAAEEETNAAGSRVEAASM